MQGLSYSSLALYELSPTQPPLAPFNAAPTRRAVAVGPVYIGIASQDLLWGPVIAPILWLALKLCIPRAIAPKGGGP